MLPFVPVDQTDEKQAPRTRDVQRAALAAKLRREGRDDLAEVLDRCAEPLALRCLCCQVAMQVDTGCTKRWCPVCGPRITAKRFSRFQRLAERFQWPLSVTLTRKNVLNSPEALEAFKEDFRAFRRTSFWRNTVRGGVAGFEITTRGETLHPHLHALVDAEWLAVATPKPQRGSSRKHREALCKAAQKELGEVWGAYVHGKRAQVWVQRVTFGQKDSLCNALAETLKYAVKTSDLLKARTHAATVIDQIDRGRAVTTFGHAHAASKEFVGIEDVPPPPKLCRDCGADRSLFPAEVVTKLRDGMWPPAPRLERMIRAGDNLEEARALGINPHEFTASLAAWAQESPRPRLPRRAR